MVLTEKTLSVSAIKEGTVIDHIAPGQALSLIRHLKFAEEGMRITIGLNLRSASGALKDLIKLEGVFLTETQASQIAVFSPMATVNVIEDYKVAKKFRVRLPERIEGLLVCPNSSCITHAEKLCTVFKVEENNRQVLLLCNYCEKTFELSMKRVLSDD
jgi:aspartate carbamoyltransferase regulatory subunit